MSWKQLIRDNAVVFAAWLAFYGFRPFSLGLYHDDWAIFLDSPSTGSTLSLIQVFGNRPVLGLYHIATTWLSGGNLAVLHFYASLVVLGTALILRSFIRQLLHFVLESNGYVSSVIGACIWLVMPWTLGTSAWLTTNPTLFCVMGFALAGTSLIRFWRGKAGLLPWFPLSILLSCLAYEFFIPQFIILVCFFYAQSSRCIQKIPAQPVLRPLGWLLATYGVVYLIRKFGESFGKSAVKAYYADWLTTFFVNLKSDFIRQSLPSNNWLLLLGLAISIGLIGLTLISLFTEQALRGVRRSFLVAILLCCLGYAASCLVPSFIGFRLTGTGVDSRSTIGVSLWIALFISLIFGIVSKSRMKPLKITGVTAFTFYSIVLSASMATQLSLWHDVWESESSLLRDIKQTSIEDVKRNSIIVLDGPISHKGIYGFASYWDFQAALHWTFPNRRDLKALVATDWWRVRRKGLHTVQSNAETVLADYNSEESWVINSKSGELRQLLDGQSLGAGRFP
ncbi:hypothetical protein [Synechococcus sp. CS-1332]|uniref:hypothetical protein n=1 Tax=Synechococcus sp. CS-1332 TaxID=2847972 RepID=UPI00223BF936|nr:hypothetical protein [Synechococcus sp. CS-1332]MCT0206233.1 hypothetical protein [Synechococcus sp. CS-1332]